MFRISIAVLIVLLVTSTTNRAQSPDKAPNLTLQTKINRLRVLFQKQHLELPAGLTEDTYAEQAFRLLQDFSDAEHAWALQLPDVPAASWGTLAKESYPGSLERTLRSTTVKAEVIQQPKTVQIFDLSTSQTVPQRNPDSVLWKLSSVTDYSQFFPTTSDVQLQAATLRAAGVNLSRRARGLGFCTEYVSTEGTGERSLGDQKFEDCLLRTGRRYRGARMLSGFKGTFSWSQNPHVLSGTLVPSQFSLDNQVFSGQIDFDPTNIVINGSDWYAAYQSAVSYGSQQEDDFVKYISKKCGDPILLISDGCVDKLTKPQGLNAVLALFVPTVTFVEKTNFDFTASNGTIIANQFPSKRLSDLTFSFDLTRFVPSAKSRQDALATLSAIASKKLYPPQDPKITLDNLVAQWASKPEALETEAFYNNLISALSKIPRP